MNLPPTVDTVRCLPRGFSAKNGMCCQLRLLPTDAGQRLIDMYLAFQPRNCFQGLPPIKDAVCVKWVQDMLRTGIHLTAEKGISPICAQHPEGGHRREALVGGKLDLSPFPPIVGHAALFPINAQKCEMLVVVCPGLQNVGIGTELVQSCIDLADELGFQRIWLPVDATNVRARHVYRKCGFEYVSNPQGREMDMACEVRRWRRTAAVPPPVACSCVPLAAGTIALQ
jgi:RimJ/RimL family protein N-acetyltransferase